MMLENKCQTPELLQKLYTEFGADNVKVVEKSIEKNF